MTDGKCLYNATVRGAAQRTALLYCSAVLLMLVVVVHGHAMAQSSCIGDCNGDDHVTVNELITGVNVELGIAELDTCRAIDCNARFPGILVPIDCMVAAVNNAMQGCDVPSTCTADGTVVTCTWPPS